MGAEFIQSASDQMALRHYENIKHRTGLGNPKSTGSAWSNLSVPVTLQSCLPADLSKQNTANETIMSLDRQSRPGAICEQNIWCWLQHLKINHSSPAPAAVHWPSPVAGEVRWQPPFSLCLPSYHWSKWNASTAYFSGLQSYGCY